MTAQDDGFRWLLGEVGVAICRRVNRLSRLLETMNG